LVFAAGQIKRLKPADAKSWNWRNWTVVELEVFSSFTEWLNSWVGV
jgi:hypothetical protein